MKILKQIWDDVSRGENIDVYLTIVGAVALSALSLLGIALGEKIAGVTLAVLALLAINTLVTRHKLDRLLELQTTIKWFQEEYPKTVNNDIENARELWLVGYHLEGTLRDRLVTFKQKLERGEKIKIILLNPESEAALYANESLYVPMAPGLFKQRIEISLDTIKQMSKDYPANLEVRLSSSPVPFGAYAMNLDAPNAVMYIEIYKYKSEIKEPHFVLYKKDVTWFKLYHDQLNALWKNAKPYTIS
jgi:hypothetical protein